MSFYQKYRSKSCSILAGSLLFLCFVYSNLGLADSFDGQVVRAFFTSKLKNNNPVNEVLILENDIRKLYFYSEVQNMSGKTLTHRWEHRGEKVYKQKFKIVKDSQKLVSSYKLSPARTGEWMVIVSDEKGVPIRAVMFKYVKKGSFAGKGIVPLR